MDRKIWTVVWINGAVNRWVGKCLGSVSIGQWIDRAAGTHTGHLTKPKPRGSAMPPYVRSDLAIRLARSDAAQYNLPTADSAVRYTRVLWYILSRLGTLFRGTMREQTCGNLEPVQLDADGHSRNRSNGPAYASRLPDPSCPTPVRTDSSLERPAG